MTNRIAEPAITIARATRMRGEDREGIDFPEPLVFRDSPHDTI
jgi:hypothetical protein